MTFTELLAKITDLRQTWSDKSNATTDRDELIQACEQYISDMDDLLHVASGNNPPPPPPRIRP